MIDARVPRPLLIRNNLACYQSRSLKTPYKAIVNAWKLHFSVEVSLSYAWLLCEHAHSAIDRSCHSELLAKA